MFLSSGFVSGAPGEKKDPALIGTFCASAQILSLHMVTTQPQRVFIHIKASGGREISWRGG